MTLNLLTNADRSGVHTDRLTNVQKLLKNKLELFDVVFDQKTAILVLDFFFFFYTGARTLNKNFV